MFDFLNKPYPFNTDLGYSLKMVFGVAIGVFLFILFFQPFELQNDNFESYILTIAGFAGITLLVIGFVKIILPWTTRRILRFDLWDLKREAFIQLIIWILNSVAFSFYIAYVGHMTMSMYLAFKIVLICLAMPVMMMLIYEIHILRGQLTSEHKINLELQEHLGNEATGKVRPVEIYSDNRSEKLVFEPETLILVSSAENYVEVVFRENGIVQKKLLRNTMISIEDQLRIYPEMVRCHRTCIINIGQVEKLHRTTQGIKLRVINYEEEIPVSRQYLLGVKSALEKTGN